MAAESLFNFFFERLNVSAAYFDRKAHKASLSLTGRCSVLQGG